MTVNRSSESGSGGTHALHEYSDECSVCRDKRVAEIRKEWELEGDGLIKGRLWLIEDRKALCGLASDAIEDLLYLLAQYPNTASANEGRDMKATVVGGETNLKGRANRAMRPFPEGPRHVCGLSGFGVGVGSSHDFCPACDAVGTDTASAKRSESGQ